MIKPGTNLGGRIIRALFVSVCALILVSAFFCRLVVNESESLPHWLFAAVAGLPPGRGDLVTFTPPPSAAYRLPFVKKVTGLPGDRVIRDGRCFSLQIKGEGDKHPLGCAKSLSLQGCPLEVGEPGVIPENTVWVHTDHPDSYDSRYADIGLIHRDAFLGRTFALGGRQRPAWLHRLTTWGDETQAWLSKRTPTGVGKEEDGQARPGVPLDIPNPCAPPKPKVSGF